MSLVFAALTPHPPILVPTIGKEEIKKLDQTKQAMLELEKDLYAARPQIILIISPHGSLFADAFSVNAHTPLVSAFETFGDLIAKKQWIGAPELAAKIGHEARTNELSVQLVSQEQIDHGASVPLLYLTEHLPHVQILPIGYSELPREAHIRYGELLKEVIMSEKKRVAVIASGDLSHCLTVNAPVSYHSAGEQFDQEIIKLLEMHNSAGIIQLDFDLIRNAAECGYPSLLILLGILKNMHYTFKRYSYEAPFGVGYLVGNFVL
ncbi:MAG: AmmeMemoRadiSam system protein B [Patescibacteria group bacterium]